MKILALNSGSSSIKYRLFDSDNHFQILQQGLAERIGQKSSFPDHKAAMKYLFSNENKALRGIDAIGHRIVHGGERFIKPVLINKAVVKEIAGLAEFAPLHCEPNIIGIEVLQEKFPNIPQVAVFDTAAHASLPPKAFLYGIPYEYYEKYKIRRYGFHGINHSYVAHVAARQIKKPLEALKVITCHLGNGCSISAFDQGKSIDNSMGFTPLEGLVMGTRSGDLDPSIVLYLLEKLGLQIHQMRDLLNTKSGLFGLSRKSDMRDIITMAEGGCDLAKITLEIFVYRIQKYIGAYAAALNGVDVIVFTGGIGENSSYIRTHVMKNFSYLGAHIDHKKNEENDVVFSTVNSKFFMMTIPANEEKEIAEQTYQLLQGK